jgi:proline iminopeptidase
MRMTPDDYTLQESSLEVGDGHSLYVHEWGNPKAKTVIFHIHGGPGSGTSDRAKRSYNPDRQHIIFFDQRGAGKSIPTASLEHNTTDDLVDDISKIADYLGIKTFILSGGSWGSCLALAYAIKHPDRVRAMVLNGIFTASAAERAWLEQGMFRIFYPDVWERYLSYAPESRDGDPTTYHFERILGDDVDAGNRSAYAYDLLSRSIVSLDDRPDTNAFEDFDPNPVRMEVHYMANDCFMPNNYILDNAHELTMPVWIVQGRYDMVCPPKTAHTLAKALPNGELIWTTSGHKPERESWNVIRTILATL